MIDTIVITLQSTHYQITKPAFFTPPAHWVLAEARTAHIISKQNHLKRELIQGIYKPRLTLANRITASGKRDITLKIAAVKNKLLLQDHCFWVILNRVFEIGFFGFNASSQFWWRYLSNLCCNKQ